MNLSTWSIPEGAPRWIPDLLSAIDALPSRLKDSFLISTDVRSLICSADPSSLYDEISGEFRLSMAVVLGRITNQDQSTCSCYGCEASRGSSFAARQLGLLNELKFGSKSSDLQQAAEWYGLAAINDYEPAWVDLARIFRFMIKDRQHYDEFLQKLEPIFRKSASSSDIDEQVNLARFLISTGIDDKIAEGRLALGKLAEAGYPQALFLLGVEETDQAKSLEIITRAAQQNYAPAMLRLAKMLDNGLGIRRDTKMAIFWYERASEHRDPVAMFRLAQLIQATESQRSMALLKTIIDTSSDGKLRSQAQFTLGCAIIDQDEACAVQMLTEAANSGLGAAQAKLGLHLTQKGKSSDEIEEGLRHLGAAVNHTECDPEAALALGRYYLENDPDFSRGLSLVAKACNSGYPPALILGYRCLVETDLSQALSWLQQAASMGYADALTELGQAYEEGLVNGSPDFPQALKCYKKASTQSDVRAQFQLYSLLARDQGLTSNEFANAVRWLQLSANHGYAPAQARLGRLLLELNDEQKKTLSLDNLNCLFYLDRAAEKGDMRSVFEASKIRLEQDVETEKAFCDLIAAAESGCFSSQMLLAETYLAHIFPIKDKALLYLNLAAQKDHYAQFMKCAIMCNLHEFSKMNLTHDHDFDLDEINRGFFEAKIAALNGNMYCQYLLGLSYQRGIIVDADFNEACRWLKLSALAGCTDAALPMMHLTSGSEANHWFRVAINSGATNILFPEKIEISDESELLSLVRKAAEAGNQFAMVFYATRCDEQAERISWMEKAAHLGVPRAQRWLARYLQDRNDATSWAEWLERAAEGGDLEAQREISAWEMHPRHEVFRQRISRRQSGTPFSLDEFVVNSPMSLDELTALAESGDHRAQYCLALHLMRNQDENPLSKAAFKNSRRWLRRSARNGNPCAQVAMAMFYMTTIWDFQSCFPRALSLLLEASECGYSEAFYILALKFSNDFEQSLSFLEKAARLGHQIALCQYVSQMFGLGRTISGDILESLQQIADHNFEAAYWFCRVAPENRQRYFDVLKEAVCRNHTRSQVLFGEMFSTGVDGVPANPEAAEFCYRRAALANNDVAQVRLAKVLYAKGEYDRAFTFFEQACAQGNLAALEWLSMRPARSVSAQTRNAVQILVGSDAAPFVFFLASLFETDPVIQKAHLEKAAAKGHVMAQYLLARALLKVGDVSSALIWLRRAAEQNHVSSCLDLALCLLTGYNSISDWLTARHYLIRAIHLGSSKAACLLSTLFTMISFKYPAVSNWSIGHALLWSAPARQLKCSSDYILLRSSSNTCILEQVNCFLEECGRKNRLTALAVIHRKVTLPTSERQDVANMILRMCGDFLNHSDLDSTVISNMQKSSIIRRDAIVFQDQKRLLPTAVQYLYGDCVAPDICLASRLLQTAAGRNSAPAQVLLGFLYELGGLGVCLHPWQAWASFWYSKAVMAGNSVGSLAYAEVFERKGCWTSAALFYHRASELGSTLAHSRLMSLYDINDELEVAVARVIRAASNERALALLSGCCSESSPLYLLNEGSLDQAGVEQTKFDILRTIFEYAGLSQLVWYPEPEVNFSEFIRAQTADRNSDHVIQGDRLLLEEPVDLLAAIGQYKLAARKGNLECMVLLGNAVDCGWVWSSESASSWYQNASLIGSGLATQWIASSLLTGSSQNAATAVATLRRAQQQLAVSSSLSLPIQLYLSALSAALTDAFPFLKQTTTTEFNARRQARCVSLLLGLTWDAGKFSPLYLACESMNILPQPSHGEPGRIPFSECRSFVSDSERSSCLLDLNEVNNLYCGDDQTEINGQYDPVIHQIFSVIFEMSGDILSKS